jgi:hypothetical protein
MEFKYYKISEFLELINKIPKELHEIISVNVSIVKQDEPLIIDKEIKDIRQEDIDKYIDFMYKGAKKLDGKLIAPGYIKLSKQTQMGLEKCRKIRGHLERLNVIKSLDKSTIILKSRNQLNLKEA